MATLLCANVIANTNALTLSEKLRALWATLSDEPTESVAIVAPAPQRPAADFATILHWEESDKGVDGDKLMPPQHHNNAYLHSGGLYTQRLLACGRVMARYATEIDYVHAMNNPALANQAPPWPPAPEHIADALTWGAPVNSGVAPPAHAPQDSDMETGASASGTGDDWSAPSFGWVVPGQDTSSDEETEWEGLTSSLLFDAADSEDECATGFFIGRDGTAWPVPPRECMPHNIPVEGFRDSHPTSQHAQPECRIVWSAEHSDSDLGSDSDSDSDSDTTGSQSPPLDFEYSAADSERSSPSTTQGSQPSTPPDVPLANLGLLWYTSFGKELGLSTTLNVHSHDRASPPPPPIETLAEEAQRAGLFDTGGFFLGRDGSLWPLPPSPPILDAFDIGYGRRMRYSSSHGTT
ncbi:hypothetical protein GY45DRAFT_1365782 [Cubamyces sp. BRFM 1775]|nr:hypothetical protein GY45DRAFT_1365782 [Cubamyces sp. BRFM 1775]